jgi:hypothetical protein
VKHRLGEALIVSGSLDLWGGGNTESVKRSSVADSAVKETDSARCLSSATAMISSKRASIQLKISPNCESIRSKISHKLDSILRLGLGWEKSED